MPVRASFMWLGHARRYTRDMTALTSEDSWLDFKAKKLKVMVRSTGLRGQFLGEERKAGASTQTATPRPDPHFT